MFSCRINKPMRSVVFILLGLSFSITAFSNANDTTEVWRDSLNHVCTFDGVLNSVTARVFKAKDVQFVSQLKFLKKKVRAFNYLKIKEAGFVNTAGAAWIDNNQVVVHNRDRIKAIRNMHIPKDSIDLLLRGIGLHELAHHMLPHAVFKVVKAKVAADSARFYEIEADVFMGQFLRSIYRYSLTEVKYVIRKLSSSPDNFIVKKSDRLLAVEQGWKNYEQYEEAKFTVAFAKINRIDRETDIPKGGWKFSTMTLGSGSDTVGLNKSKYEADFRIRKTDNGSTVLEVKYSALGNYKRIGRVMHSSIPEFPRTAYDDLFNFWYINNDGEIYNDVDGQLFYTGKLGQ